MSASIVKNTATAANRTIPFVSYDTDGNARSAALDTLRLSGPGVAVRNALGTITQVEEEAHRYEFTLAESDLFAAGVYGTLSVPPDVGVQGLSFSFLVTEDNVGAAPSTDAEIAEAFFTRAFDATKMAGYTFEQLVGLMASVLLAKASGMDGATGTFRNLGDTADAVVATQDADGNRTAVTRTPASVV